MYFDVYTIAGLLTLFVVVASFFVSFNTAVDKSVATPPLSGFVTVSINDIILVRDAKDRLSIDESFAPKLTAIAETHKLMVIVTVQGDKEALEALEVINASFISKLVPEHRIIFSDTEEGRISIVRQLQPSIHYDTSEAVISALTDKTPKLIIITSPDSILS